MRTGWRIAEVKKKAFVVKNVIEDNEEVKKAIVSLFERWRQETIVQQDEEIDENSMDDTEDYEEEVVDMAYDVKLYQQLKPLLKKLSWLRRF